MPHPINLTSNLHGLLSFAASIFITVPSILAQAVPPYTYDSYMANGGKEGTYLQNVVYSEEIGQKRATAKTTTLHIVLVADTADRKVGKSCKVDLDRWDTRIKDIQYQNRPKKGSPDINVITRIITPSGAWGRDACLTACDSLKIKPNDAVLFAYSGHGYYTDEVKNKWPTMALGETPTGEVDALELKDVYLHLKKKEPRILLVIADCCNSRLPSVFTPIHEDLLNKLMPKNPVAARQNNIFYFREQYNKLFKHSRGNWIVSSSQRGLKNFSYGTALEGGFFSKRLDMLLQSHIDKSWNADWHHIFGAITASPIPHHNKVPQIPQADEEPSFKH